MPFAPAADTAPVDAFGIRSLRLAQQEAPQPHGDGVVGLLRSVLDAGSLPAVDGAACNEEIFSRTFFRRKRWPRLLSLQVGFGEDNRTHHTFGESRGEGYEHDDFAHSSNHRATGTSESPAARAIDARRRAGAQNAGRHHCPEE